MVEIRRRPLPRQWNRDRCSALDVRRDDDRRRRIKGRSIAYVVNRRQFIAAPFGGNPGEADALSDVVAAFALPNQ